MFREQGAIPRRYMPELLHAVNRFYPSTGGSGERKVFQSGQSWRDICSCAANETFSLMQDGAVLHRKRELCALTERVCREFRFQATDKWFQGD